MYAPYAPIHNYYPLKEVIKLWILWTLLAIVGSIPAALTIDTLFARKSQCWMNAHLVRFDKRQLKVTYQLMDTFAPDFIRTNRVNRKALVWVPGILARKNQIEPLMSLYQEYDVYATVYGGKRFDGKHQEVPSLAGLITYLAMNYDSITIVGASHGGMLATRAIALLSDATRNSISEVKLVDCPSGIESLAPLPSFAAGFFKPFKPGTLTNIVLFWVLLLFKDLPKDKNIHLPSRKGLQELFLDPDMTQMEYAAWVKACAKENLSGHKFSMWYSEVQDMGKELPLRALEGLHVTYIACMLDGNVIAQPQALEAYSRGVTNLTIHKMNVTHCGFTEFYEEYVQVMR